MSRLRQLKQSGQSGSTILEASIAAAIIVLVLAAIGMANTNCFSIVQAHKETTAVNDCLQERVEKLRAGGWDYLTDAQKLKELLTDAAASSTVVPAMTEQLAVSVYPPPTPPPTAPDPLATPSATPSPPPATVVRREPDPEDPSKWVIKIVSESSAKLRSATAVRLDVRAKWESSRAPKRIRIREFSTVVARQ